MLHNFLSLQISHGRHSYYFSSVFELSFIFEENPLIGCGLIILMLCQMYENPVYDTDDDDDSVIEVEGPAKPPAPVITLRGESEDEDEAGGQQQQQQGGQQQQQQGGGGGDGHAHVQQMGGGGGGNNADVIPVGEINFNKYVLSQSRDVFLEFKDVNLIWKFFKFLRF